MYSLGEGAHLRVVAVATVAIFFAFFVASSKTYWFLIFPLSVLILIYSPIAYVYGRPDFQAVISLTATNLNEALEFIGLLSPRSFLSGTTTLLCLLLAHFIAKWINFGPWKNNVLILVTVAALVVISEPVKFFRHLYESSTSAYSGLAEVKKYVNQSSWINSTKIERKPKDFILVIGESARRDYFHVYGYPVENTPFLDKAPATIVDGFHVPDSYTIGSLRIMLTQTTPPFPGQYHYDYNVIDLAKSAGIKTTWLSNQGFLGSRDTPISAIGSRADKSIFPNRGDYTSSTLSDFALIKLLKSQLADETNQDHLYVLHTIGSHPDICERLTDMAPEEIYKVDSKELNEVACYVSTIRKVDILLEKLYDLMQEHKKETGREFSIIYFSDHGLAHRAKRADWIQLTNNLVSPYHFDVPLIMIDSENPERKFLTSTKSSLLFTEGLAHWMGIINPRLTGYNLFDGVSDTNDYGFSEQLKKFKFVSPDPAIDITSHLVH